MLFREDVVRISTADSARLKRSACLVRALLLSWHTLLIPSPTHHHTLPPLCSDSSSQPSGLDAEASAEGDVTGAAHRYHYDSPHCHSLAVWPRYRLHFHILLPAPSQSGVHARPADHNCEGDRARQPALPPASAGGGPYGLCIQQAWCARHTLLCVLRLFHDSRSTCSACWYCYHRTATVRHSVHACRQQERILVALCCAVDMLPGCSMSHFNLSDVCPCACTAAGPRADYPSIRANTCLCNRTH